MRDKQKKPSLSLASIIFGLIQTQAKAGAMPFTGQGCQLNKPSFIYEVTQSQVFHFS